jgi:hypothetical protein
MVFLDAHAGAKPTPIPTGWPWSLPNLQCQRVALVAYHIVTPPALTPAQVRLPTEATQRVAPPANLLKTPKAWHPFSPIAIDSTIAIPLHP